MNLPLTLFLLVLVASSNTLAEKGGVSAREKHAHPAPPTRAEFHFNDRERDAVKAYYGSPKHTGHCPPGLAKKNKGCLPPGQARKWHIGQPLPRDVVYHDLPVDLRLRLPPPPEGHRYVRVASDILLIAIGTAMIIDAMEDIAR
jgi:Ni/Co efflux regulator RcnB